MFIIAWKLKRVSKSFPNHKSAGAFRSLHKLTGTNCTIGTIRDNISYILMILHRRFPLEHQAKLLELNILSIDTGEKSANFSSFIFKQVPDF